MMVMRNIFALIIGLGILFLAVTAGIFVLMGLAVVGLILVGYFKLRGKNIINPINKMGETPYEEANHTEIIEVEYEVVEEEKEKKID